MSMRDEAVMRSPDDGWLSTTYVAHALGVTIARVHEMVRTGVLEGHRIGHVIRIRKSELARYLAQWKASQPRSNRP